MVERTRRDWHDTSRNHARFRQAHFPRSTPTVRSGPIGTNVILALYRNYNIFVIPLISNLRYSAHVLFFGVHWLMLSAAGAEFATCREPPTDTSVDEGQGNGRQYSLLSNAPFAVQPPADTQAPDSTWWRWCQGNLWNLGEIIGAQVWPTTSVPCWWCGIWLSFNHTGTLLAAPGVPLRRFK